MDKLTFENVFLAILAAMVGQNRVLAPSYQKAVATNAIEMTAAVLAAIAEYQERENPTAVTIDPSPDERKELAAALGLQTTAMTSIRPSAQEMLDASTPASDAAIDSDAS